MSLYMTIDIFCEIDFYLIFPDQIILFVQVS